MTLAQVVDGVTDLDSALFNPIIDAVNSSSNALDGVVNVLDYGVVGDGTTDDLTAIGNAISAAAEDGIGTVVLPALTMRISNTVVVPQGIRIVGSGRRSTILKAAGSFPTSTPLVQLGADSESVAHGTSVSNLTIDCYGITGSRGVTSGNIQEQSGLSNVDVISYMDRAIHIDGTTGGAEHFHITDVECYSHPSATNPRGIYFQTVGSALLLRVTVFCTTGSKSSRAAFEFNDAEFTGIDLHAEYFHDGVLLYNTSGGAVFGMGGKQLTVMANVATDARWFFGAHLGMIGSSVSYYLQDQIHGQLFTSPVAFHAAGNVWTNGLRYMGYSETDSTPSTTELPETRSYGIHKNTNDSKVYLAYNDGGSVKKVELA